MKLFIYLTLIFSFLTLSLNSFANSEVKDNDSFNDWVLELKKIAKDKNYQENLTDQIFSNIFYSKEYLEQDKRQFEPQTFDQYYQNAINKRRIRKAKVKIHQNHDILIKIEDQFQVPKEYIVSLWAVETDFGRLKGKFNVINSLANLSFDKRRRELFLKEFFAAIDIIKNNNINPEDLRGSWAGAIGQCQFLPSTYLKYGYDFDNDGKIDIWRNKSDIFASIANYLKSIGWNNKARWGYEIRNNKELKESINFKQKYTLQYLFDKYKINKKINTKFSDHELSSQVSVIKQEDKLFITFDNFDLIKEWNNSTYFALTIGLLSDLVK